MGKRGPAKKGEERPKLAHCGVRLDDEQQAFFKSCSKKGELSEGVRNVYRFMKLLCKQIDNIKTK